jgi:hypothetical protein
MIIAFKFNHNVDLLRKVIAVVAISAMLSARITPTLAQDFSKISIDSVKSLLQPTTKNVSKIILGIGSTNKSEFINPLIEFLQTNSKLGSQVKWSAHLALARLGEPNALAFILQRVQKLGINDDVVYDIFSDLVYTRQRQAFNYLIEVIKSDEKKCMSADPENPEPMNCGYRVLELIAPVIKDFPLKVDSSGDLEVKEYAVALRQVRKWLEKNPDYEIIN